MPGLLEAFFSTGKLGPLEPGMAREQVLALLGRPEDLSVPGHKPLLYKYGWLQMAFADRRRLAWIGLYPDDAEHGPPLALSWLSDTIVFRKTDIDMFKAYLQQADIEFSLDEDLTFDEQVFLRAGVGVQVGFVDGGRTLYTLQYTQP